MMSTKNAARINSCGELTERTVQLCGPCATWHAHSVPPKEKDPLGVLVLGVTSTKWRVVSVSCG